LLDFAHERRVAQFQFSQVICLERDITPKANCSGSMSQ